MSLNINKKFSFDFLLATLTSDTTTMTTQQLTGITQLPATTSILNGKLIQKIVFY